MTLVERIKLKCQENGTNIRRLEEATGMGNGTIRKWDTQCPSYDKVIKVANYLNVTINWLLFEKEAADLTPEERELVDCYRQANDQGKRSIMGIARLQKQELESSSSRIG